MQSSYEGDVSTMVIQAATAHDTQEPSKTKDYGPFANDNSTAAHSNVGSSQSAFTLADGDSRFPMVDSWPLGIDCYANVEHSWQTLSHPAGFGVDNVLRNVDPTINDQYSHCFPGADEALAGYISFPDFTQATDAGLGPQQRCNVVQTGLDLMGMNGDALKESSPHQPQQPQVFTELPHAYESWPQLDPRLAKQHVEQELDIVNGAGDQSAQTDEFEVHRCWDHGCNGQRFASKSNLRRHQREKSGLRAERRCPRCGAIFSRSTARNQHFWKKSCTRIRRYSNGRARPTAALRDVDLTVEKM